MVQRKLEAVAVQLPEGHKTGHRLGIRAGSTEDCVTLYVDGRYTGDFHLEEAENGNLILVVFLPTDGPAYHKLPVQPSRYEWDRRHPDFERHEFDWR